MEIRGFAFSLMSEFIERFRSRHAGLTRNLDNIDDVGRALFDEKSTPAGEAMAAGIRAIFSSLSLTPSP